LESPTLFWLAERSLSFAIAVFGTAFGGANSLHFSSKRTAPFGWKKLSAIADVTVLLIGNYERQGGKSSGFGNTKSKGILTVASQEF
jgi:hypothetical protein